MSPSRALTLLFVGIFLFIPRLQNQSIYSYSGRPWKVDRYITRYYYLANQLFQDTGIPIAITLAVAGLESDWGMSELALNGNNHFGIKDEDWTGPVYCTSTLEWQPTGGFLPVTDCFRKYSLIAQSYQDFGAFLSFRSHYEGIFQHPSWDYGSWAWELQLSGYATDPSYAQKLLRLIREYELYLYDQ